MDIKRDYVDLKLSLKSEREQVMSKVQKEIIQDELNQLTPIMTNDINISTGYIFDMGDKLEASVFFRNGLNNQINFDKVPLSIVDKNNQVILSQIFSLREVGNIPPKCARPWKLYFDKSYISKAYTKLEECRVIFSEDINAITTVECELENEMNNLHFQKRVEQYMRELPLVEKGNINIDSFEVKLKDTESIVITIIVRNGTNERINIEKLPVTLRDLDNKVICSLLLELSKLTISPRKAKVYNLILKFNPEKYLEYNFEQLSVSFNKE